MSSLYPKKVNGQTYWYLRTMARVDGKPKMVSERYLGSAADVAAAAALVSSLARAPLPADAVYFGEVSLSGAVRPVAQTATRLKEAQKLGFTRAIVPEAANYLLNPAHPEAARATLASARRAAFDPRLMSFVRG